MGCIPLCSPCSLVHPADDGLCKGGDGLAASQGQRECKAGCPPGNAQLQQCGHRVLALHLRQACYPNPASSVAPHITCPCHRPPAQLGFTFGKLTVSRVVVRRLWAHEAVVYHYKQQYSNHLYVGASSCA